MDKIENHFNKFKKELNECEELYINNSIKLESDYLHICKDIKNEYYESFRKLIGKVLDNTVNEENNKVINYVSNLYNKKCNPISSMPFKSIYFKDQDILINISMNGSKWTCDKVIKTNPVDNSKYTRYLTTIEADPTQGLGSKRGHSFNKSNICNHVEWIFIETNNPLINQELIFPIDETYDEHEINFNLEEYKQYIVNIEEQILSFGYQIQKRYKNPEIYNFPKNIYFFNSALEKYIKFGI